MVTPDTNANTATAATPALDQFPVVVDVREGAANERPPLSARPSPPSPVGAEASACLTLWDMFVALQDAAEEAGATPDEADRLAIAAYDDLNRYLVP
jgi:hypothetical protein